MNPGMKMLLMTSRSEDKNNSRAGERGDNNRSVRNEYERYEGAYSNYDVEDRFRDRRGREHYDNGRYAPMRNHFEPEDNYNRREMNRPQSYEPPMYERSDRREGGERPTNLIGFAREEHEPRFKEIEHNYNASADYRTTSELDHGKNSRMNNGYAKTNSTPKLTHGLAMEWTEHLSNTDGTKGAHWTMEQAKQVMAQKGVMLDPLEFFVALNLMYSDYAQVAKQLSINSIDFYVGLAKAFLDDPDAGDDKLMKYYECVVKK